MFIYFSKWFLQHGTWSLKAAQDGEVLLFPCSLASSTSPKRLQSNETKCRPRQSFLSFQSYKYKVPCLSCPFCTLLEKSTVWKVPMFKLKRSESICKCLHSILQFANLHREWKTTHETFVQNESLGPVPWCSMARATASASLFVCIFLPKEKYEETTVISLAVAESLEVFWIFHASKQFLRFPFMPASKCYCIQLKPWLAQNLWKKRGTVAVRHNYTYLAIFIRGDSVQKKRRMKKKYNIYKIFFPSSFCCNFCCACSQKSFIISPPTSGPTTGARSFSSGWSVYRCWSVSRFSVFLHRI